MSDNLKRCLTFWFLHVLTKLSDTPEVSDSYNKTRDKNPGFFLLIQLN